MYYDHDAVQLRVRRVSEEATALRGTILAYRQQLARSRDLLKLERSHIQEQRAVAAEALYRLGKIAASAFDGRGDQVSGQ